MFDHATGGNGFDARRRLIEPLGPNTESRLFEMHRDIINPKASKSLNDLLHDLNVWEGERDEYYRCGGDRLSDRSEIMTAHKLFPANTPESYRTAVRYCRSFDEFKRELRDTMRYLEDSGGKRTG